MPEDSVPAQEDEPKAKVFISYSRRDMAFVDRLEPALKARGFEPLIDRAEIYAFEDWWKRLQALIERADTIVFVLSPDSVASHEAMKEVEYAASLNKRLAPIVCRRVEDAAVPETLRRLNFVFFDDAAQFEASGDRLAEALQTDIGWIRKHTEYGEAARQWSAAGPPGGLQLRSPALEDAERWIASRPGNAPVPTAETQAFVADSRRGATRRRNIFTGSLAAGFIVALVLAGLAYWQREVAVVERQIADQQRQRAEDTLAAATKTANSLVFDLAQRFRDTMGIPASLIKDILDRARGLQTQLAASGPVSPDLKQSEAAALAETAELLLAIGDTAGALSAAKQAAQISTDLAAADPGNTTRQHDVSVANDLLGESQFAQGNLADALSSYNASLAISERLAKADPGDEGPQRDLTFTGIKVGDVQVARGEMKEALASFGNALAIMERLAQTDPNNGASKQLSLTYLKVGEVQVEQGNLAGALASFRNSLAAAQRLADANSNNADSLRQVPVALDRIGNVQVEQGDLQGALVSYQRGFDVSLASGHVRPQQCRLATRSRGRLWQGRRGAIENGQSDRSADVKT